MQIFEFFSILRINFCPSGSTCLSATLLPHPQTSCSFLPRVSQSIFVPETSEDFLNCFFLLIFSLPRVSQIIFAPQTHDLLFSFHFSQFSLLTWISQRISAPKTHAGFLIQIKIFAGFWCPTDTLLTSDFYFLNSENGHHSSSSSSGAHFIYNSF